MPYFGVRVVLSKFGKWWRRGLGRWDTGREVVLILQRLIDWSHDHWTNVCNMFVFGMVELYFFLLKCGDASVCEKKVRWYSQYKPERNLSQQFLNLAIHQLTPWRASSSFLYFCLIICTLYISYETKLNRPWNYIYTSYIWKHVIL